MKVSWSLFVLFVLLMSCDSGESVEIERWNERAANVEIIRDDFGVPHIYGKSDADAVFGLLFAQCEDDFNRVERNYIWAIGRLAEVEGEEVIYSDLRARLFMTKEEAIAEYEQSPQWLQDLCVAFADGVNYYLHTHPDVTPALITHFEPWMPMYFSEGSIGGDIERVSTQKIQEFYEDFGMPATHTSDIGMLQPQDNEPRGSNGFAISGKLTESGNAMLLINPHTSFFFRGEVHVVSEEGLNTYGAVTWGQFFVYQGFNEHTGWMHTSTYTDVMDEYVETIEQEGGGWTYDYGDEERSVVAKEVTLKYKDGDQIAERTFPIFRTHHGPITGKLNDKWIATAMMWEPKEALIQSYTRTKLSGHGAFDEMMEMRTNSSNNTVYADADGTIAYYHGNFIPKRDTLFDFTEPVDGSDPATDWKGLHSVGEAIVVVNPANGWIQNCNSTPFTCAAEYSPDDDDFPEYMSLNRENFRGIHASRLLSQAKDLTLDKLIEIAYDPYLPAFEVLIPGLLEAYERNPRQNAAIQKPIELLRNWDFAVSKNSEAMTLAHFYGLQYGRAGTAPEESSRMEAITYYGTESPINERLEIFRKTIEKLNDDFGTWQIPWGEVNRYQRLSGAIRQDFNDDAPSLPIGMASGSWGALASFGARSYDETKRLYGTSGNSFVAVVEFGEKVSAKSLLAGGQSGDPNSPHFDDQAQRYADVQFKEVAYYREDVEKRAKRTYRPGK